MKLKIFLILFATLTVAPAIAEDVELTQVEQLTSQYFIMAYKNAGTYLSPYWTRGNNQNALTPGESAIICHGSDYYYLLKAQAITYKGEKVYRITISNGAHTRFPNGIGGAPYVNSSQWGVIFSGECEATGKSHVYGQDYDAGGLWRIIYTKDKGFQFQCVNNDKYINYTMGQSSTANKYFWQCFAEGSLYDPIQALKVSAPFVAFNELSKMLKSLVADKTNITCDDTEREIITESLTAAQANVDAATTETDVYNTLLDLRAKGCTFLNAITLADGYQLNVTPLIINASFPCDNAVGWEGTEAGFQSHNNAEFYSKTYNFHQTLPDMPQGTYLLRMQGYQRSKDANDKEMTDYLNGIITQSEGYLYVDEEQMALSLITRDAQTTDHIGGAHYTVNGTEYWMPNSMNDASKFFANGMYWNNMTINHLTRDNMTIGIRCNVGAWGTWTCFDNFELYYQGASAEVSDVTFMLTNPSFETGNTDGWTVGHPSGGSDVGAKKNEGVYLTEGTDGDYLFNTFTNSDSYVLGSQEHFVEQTLTNMKPGEYRLRALASSNNYLYAQSPVELYGNSYVTSFVPQSKTEFKQTYEVTIYLTPSQPNLTIGMRSASWFRADHFRLIYFGITEEYEKVRRLSTTNRYEEIANQALDRSNYDAVLSEVRTALMADEITDEEIASQNAKLREALMNLIKTGETESGQFDLTALLENRGIKRAAATRTLTTIEQNMADMPAGHYTFRANALYRPTAIAKALEQYEDGKEEHSAYIFISDKQEPVPGIFDDARHAATSPTDIYATIDGRSIPMTESTAISAFNQGDYGVAVESDLETDGELNLGFRINATTQTENWFIASRLQLLYGNGHDTYVNKTLTAGQLTPLCVPFELNSDEVGQLYAIGSIQDKQAMLFPVNTIHAGEPCVLNAKENMTGFTIQPSKVRDKKGDTTPLPWDGGTITSDLTNYTWTTTTIDGKTVTTADNLTFVVADPMNMDFTVNLENLQARRFIELENYTTTNSSHIDKYNITPPARRDHPNNVGIPVVADGNTKLSIVISENEDLSQAKTLSGQQTDGKLFYIPNLIPQRTYYYEVKSGEAIVGRGKFHTEGHLRMIYAPSISNIRDLGGWRTTDGQYVRYGLIYRGGELNGGHVATTADIKRLRDLGIGAEIDLRVDYENGAGKSAFNFTTSNNTFYFANGNDCYPESMSSQESYDHWKSAFNLLLTNLKQGKSVYFHCIWGADRTGLFSLLLEGLLGIPQDQSNKNYELTTFSLAGIRTRGTQDAFFNYINDLKGTTLQKRFNTFFVDKIGIQQSDIDEFRQIMLTKDLADAIEEIPVTRETGPDSDAIYDLSGRRIPNDRPTRGVYIKNGKKFLVK